ncbi:conserved hypothetical protein [Ricinus communis]|uniref:Uncharacterized protein n=1 Tax=Ricinus communis TaxID=3988 RepID=B9SDE7_RICCO|nr:conserved hypothetical protein [Ricinus communis]
MATKHNLEFIFLLFLFLVFSSLCNGAIYRVHRLRPHQENSDIMHVFPPTTFGLLPRGTPVPPSGPSRRHNMQPVDGGPAGGGYDGGALP